MSCSAKFLTNRTHSVIMPEFPLDQPQSRPGKQIRQQWTPNWEFRASS